MAVGGNWGALAHVLSQRVRRVQPPQLLRLPEVQRLTGIKRTHIYRLQQLGQFPKRVKLGPRASAYVASEVTAWIESRISESRK